MARQGEENSSGSGLATLLQFILDQDTNKDTNTGIHWDRR